MVSSQISLSYLAEELVMCLIILQNSGFGSHLLPGTEVLADRGFTIENILPMDKKLCIPTFTKGRKNQRVPEEKVTATKIISNVRIYVEQAIRHLKCLHYLKM